jgi:hypothetical protein
MDQGKIHSQDYCVFGICTSSDILKTAAFRELDLFLFSDWVGRGGVGESCSVGSVRKS